MSNAEPTAKSTSTPKAGTFAALHALLHLPGSGAPWLRLLAPLAVALTALLALTAAPALAGEVHGFSASFGEPGSGNGQLALAEHSGIAVNQATHDVYVADTGNGRVEQFTQAGAFVRTFGTFTTPTFIAIDNSPGGEGDLYVADSAAGTVSKFEAAGTPIASWGTGGQLTGFSEVQGISVRPGGDLFVLSGELSRYSQGGSKIASFGVPRGTAAAGLAIDTEGNLYKVDATPQVTKFSASGEDLSDTLDSRSDGAGLTIDPSEDDLYVIQSGEGGFVSRFAAGCGESCEPIEEFGAGNLSNPQGIAVDETSHHVYVASAGSSEIDVAGLEYVETPTATIAAVSAVQFTTAHLAGEVNPEGEPSTCRFDYVTEAHFEAEGFAGAQSTPCATDPGSGTSPEPVEADLTGLAPHTTYHVRLAAHNRGGTTDSAEPNQTFETEEVTAPETTISAASAITYHSAHLAGTVKLANSDPSFNASCVFQYITDKVFQENIAHSLPGFENASSQPCESETVLASESQPVAVKADIGGLSAGTVYHLRLVAANLGGNSTALASFESEFVNPPTASGLSVGAITDTSAHFSGSVNAGGSGPGEQTATYAFSCEPACPGLAGPAPITADGSPHTVQAAANGLIPNTTYVVTLTATSPGGESKATEGFETEAIAPTVATLPFVGPASSQAARVYGSINPNNSATTYFFEYGPTAAYGTAIPLTEDAEAGSGDATEAVGQDITGLAPATTYHYRIVAHNAVGTVTGSDQTLTTAASPPTTCPNEQRRSEDNSTALPDCRAYEMVTPPFKSGAVTGGVAYSSNGSSLLTRATSGFAGAEGYAVPAEVFYKTARTPSGWASVAINPPSSLYPAQRLSDFNSDLGRGVWVLRPRSESLKAADLYLREADGSLVEIGPEVPPYAIQSFPPEELATFVNAIAYVGSSRDLSHTFFQMYVYQPLWPGDTSVVNTTAKSLYEYTGTGSSEPQLVGVSDGHTVLRGETLPAYRLISDCGTSLGSFENHNTYNAISADGETVFFTPEASQRCGSSHAPEVEELYARVGQGEAARTVPISEPTHADCEACQTTGRANAEFQGASEDGSRVFFLTEQELFSGDKGNNLYEYDFAGEAGHKVVPISASAGVEEAGVQGVAAISEDGTKVYFTATGVLAGQNAEGRSPTQGQSNIYLYQRDAAHPVGQFTFIATGDIGASQLTPDGRFLAFNSASDLTPGDTSAATQVFEYDSVREELARVSVAELGCEACRQSVDTYGAFIASGHQENATVMTSRSVVDISDDGSTVDFEAGGLTHSTQAALEAGLFSVYTYRSHGPLADGQVAAISTGNPHFRARLVGMTHSGSDVFFLTTQPILGADGDTQFDLYDAREGGGFPASASTPTCEGEGCQGTPTPAPPKATPATPGFHGPGNEPGKPTCKRGFVRKHGTCVKRHAKKHRGKRQAHNNRRAGK